MVEGAGGGRALPLALPLPGCAPDAWPHHCWASGRDGTGWQSLRSDSARGASPQGFPGLRASCPRVPLSLHLQVPGPSPRRVSFTGLGRGRAAQDFTATGWYSWVGSLGKEGRYPFFPPLSGPHWACPQQPVPVRPSPELGKVVLSSGGGPTPRPHGWGGGKGLPANRPGVGHGFWKVYAWRFCLVPGSG